MTLCACGLLFTFRIGLWNIGVEGQIMMGAVFATAALRWGLNTGTAWLVLGFSFVAGAAGGALWALLAGYLKTRGGVHEIFAGLCLNFVAQGIILWLIFGPWKRPGVASMSGTDLFGLKPDRYMLMAMLFAGALAGLAGNLQVTDVYHRLLPAISSNYGYLALLVVMLANYSIWAAQVVAFFFACLNAGSIQLPMMLSLDSSLSGVIQGALVLGALAAYAWRMQRRRRKEVQVHE